MTKDFKNLANKAGDKKGTAKKGADKPSGAKPTPGWVWLLTGLLIGLLVAGGVYLFSPAQNSSTASSSTTPKSETASSKPTPGKQDAEQEDSDEEKSRFDFYTLLPDLEVIIPEKEIKEKQARSQPKEERIYMIQVGSFRKHEEADSLRAQLALLGFEADIETTTSKEGDEWLRVRLGPFDNSRELNRVRNQLHDNDINTMLVKVNK